MKTQSKKMLLELKNSFYHFLYQSHLNTKTPILVAQVFIFIFFLTTAKLIISPHLSPAELYPQENASFLTSGLQ